MGVAPHMMKVTYDLKDFSFIAGVCRSWLGFAAPAGIDEAKRAKLQAACRAAVEDKTVSGKMVELGMAPMFMTGQDYNKFCTEGKEAMGKDPKAIGLVK
jgi:tripartite-type tricarboxylate transporter receptor subunit TctC